MVGSTDTDFFLLFAHILECGGYRTMLARTIEEINVHANTSAVAAVLLDGQVGSFAAVKACATIREIPALHPVPIIAILGPQTQSTHLDLISSGVDETFMRPFTPVKLLEFLHRRLSHRRQLLREYGKLKHSGVVVDRDERTVTRGGTSIHLAPTAFSLLVCLIARPERVCSRIELIDAAWPGREFVEAPTLNVHIGRLRKALIQTGEPDLIRTVRSVGYVFGTGSDKSVAIAGTANGEA